MVSLPEKWLSLRGARVYVDANAWIYAREDEPRWNELRAFLQWAERGAWKLVTSELSLAETLSQPIRTRDRRAQNDFQKRLQNSAFLVVVPLSRAILIEGATLRATRSLELPDALHAATAKLSRCTHFLTGDEALARVVHLPTLSVEFRES